MEKSKTSTSILEQLLHETAPDNSEHDFNRIRELLHQNSQVHMEEGERAKKTEAYFRELGQRIEQSSAYLSKARKDLENITTSLRKDELNKFDNTTYEAYVNKTDKEIEDEMNVIQTQLANLESKVRILNENTYGAELNLNKSINMLKNIGTAYDN